MKNGKNGHDSEAPTDFEELANWFVEINTRFPPSEYHGAMVGALAGGMRLEPAEWQGYLYAVMGYDPATVGPSEHEQNAALMAAHAADTLDDLRSDDMAFQLFLPDDDYDLDERTEGVSHWCKGFLGGFAEAQLYRKRAGLTLPNEYPENVLEAIRDLTEIAKATARQEEAQIDEMEPVQTFDPLPEDLSELSGGVVYSDEDEKDFLEISEYVRLATLTIFTEYGWIEVHEESAKKDAGQEKKPVLH